MHADIWNVLHDGTICDVTGNVPGDVTLAIEIDYLRRRFADLGDRILLTLRNCTALRYQRNDDEVLTDLVAIATAEPEILSASKFTEVWGGEGVLHLEATDYSLSLDNGRTISFADLCAVAESYWDEFSKREGSS